MENSEPTRTCGACHKEVAEANFALHESHCKRFLSLCPDCDEAVPTDQLSQHREEQHTQVKCSNCNKKMERCHIVDHMAEECPERLQACRFCELEVAWKQLQEHSVVCGSRTELCRDCGRYIKLKDLPEHSSTCLAADKDESPQTAMAALDTTDNQMSSKSCRRSFPEEQLDQHKMASPQVSHFYEEVKPKEENRDDEEDVFKQQSQNLLSSASKALSYTGTKGSWVSGENHDHISTCPHCHLALPLPTLKWHEAKCRVHIILKDREG